MKYTIVIENVQTKERKGIDSTYDFCLSTILWYTVGGMSLQRNRHILFTTGIEPVGDDEISESSVGSYRIPYLYLEDGDIKVFIDNPYGD